MYSTATSGRAAISTSPGGSTIDARSTITAMAGALSYRMSDIAAVTVSLITVPSSANVS